MTFYRVAQQVVLFLMRFGYKIKVIDKQKLPSEQEGYVIVSNHRSNLDPLFIGLGMKRQICFMAKEELFKNKFLGFILTKLGTFPVSRGKGDRGAIQNAIDIVESGRVLGIFPEGTRSKDGTLKRAKSGAVLIASKTGGKIMPVGIRYGGKKLWRREITVTYGDPIMNHELLITDTNRNDIKAASQLLMARIAVLIAEGQD